MNSLQQDIARKLLQLKAFSIQVQHPFNWANGWLAPIYLDDRKILSYPAARNFFKLELARLVAENFPDTDIIAGIAVNAIGHGLLVAEQLNLPFVSVYPFPKDHGLENQIEGDLRPRQRVVIIENQLSHGDHAKRVMDALRNNGCQVEGVVSLFNYEFPIPARQFEHAGVKVLALTDFTSLIKELQTNNLYTPEDTNALISWHKDPINWNN